jgi:DNA-binding MarR family transcriptional regulator
MTLPEAPAQAGMAGIGGDELRDDELAAWRGFLRAHAHLVRELDAELIRKHSLSLSSYDVLVQLAHSPERRLRMSELADSVLLTPSGLTRLVDRLCREGLVERVPCDDDARGSFAALTERGLERFATARRTHLDGVRRLFLRHFSESELRRLGEGWRRVADEPG